MKFEVLITKSAEEDIFYIYNYVSKNDSSTKADKLFDNIQNTILSLGEFPERGHIPPELERINVAGYLEIHYKPYRIFYQVFEDKVYVHCVLDARRNISELLQKRLIR